MREGGGEGEGRRGAGGRWLDSLGALVLWCSLTGRRLEPHLNLHSDLVERGLAHMYFNSREELSRPLLSGSLALGFCLSNSESNLCLQSPNRDMLEIG